MSDIVMTTDREALKSAILYMEKALSAFKKGLNLEIENEKINTAQKAVEKTKTAPTEAAKKVEVPKKGPEKLAPSIEDIRKVFAKIFKIGLEIGEKLLIDFSTEFAKKMIIGN